jgi:hypothetical protein
LSRNPATLMDVNNKFVQSSLHGILTAGAKYDGFQVPNPDYQGNQGEEQFLTGTAAYMKVVSQSMMGTGLAPTKTPNPLLEKMLGETLKNKSVSYVGESNGAIYKHNNVGYEFKEDAPSLGARPVAIVDALSEEESEIYLERGRELNKRIPEPALTIGFEFDIPNQLSSYKFAQTQSYYPGLNQQAEITQDMISAPGKRAYVCTALIECLLMLTDPTKGVPVKGRFGLTRAILSEEDSSQRNLNPTSGIDEKNTNTMSDHVFGRAFDIDAIGSFSNFGKSKEHYAASLNYVLSRFNSMPMQLIPDLIVINPDVAKELGVTEGFDSENTPLKTMYPNLRYVDIESAPEHKDNIHISFSHNRAGQYIGSPGWKAVSNSQTSTSDSGVSVNTEEDISEAKEKAYTNYKSGGPDLSLNELFILLTKEGPFSEEVAAVMCAVAARESVGKPSSFNGVCSETTTAWAGDYSVGMFQFNLISIMNKSRNFSGSVPIYYDGSSVNPQLILASDLAYVPGKQQGWDPNAIGKKMIELQNNGKADTDDRLWYPINQVWMLINKWGRSDFKNMSKITQSNGFYHWGDYGDRSDVGFIFKVKFQDAADVYLTSGKPIENLVDWVRDNLPKFNPKTKQYVDGWLNGDVYFDKPKDGTIKDETNSKPISYGGSSPEESPGAKNTNDDNAEFTKTQVLAAADWLKAYRIQGWLTTYRKDLNGNFQCDRFARVLSAVLGTFGKKEDNLIKEQWTGGTFERTVPTATLQQFETAFAHWENVSSGEQNKEWFASESDTAKNPPVGYLVFWSGGEDGAGHVGVSTGGGEYVDQHTSDKRPSPRAITFSGFPGSSYTYLGCSSVWSV